MPSVQMKYPSKSVQSQVKLSLLIGHGVKCGDASKDPEKPCHVLKTGLHMVFQGQYGVFFYIAFT